ncbi:MAG: MarR family winged helix-turn-helix transcriptional regulator [Alphaproteobacteria bacterium]
MRRGRVPCTSSRDLTILARDQVVNLLDEMNETPADSDLIDHVGWRLWQAAAAWKARFAAEMVAAGHGWYGEARANMIPLLDRAGTRQADLVRRAGLSKQAVQQLVDELERDGVIARQPDPDDRRGRIVVFTAAGLRALADANTVKRRIEADYRAQLGDAAFAALCDALLRLAPDA